MLLRIALYGSAASAFGWLTPLPVAALRAIGLSVSRAAIDNVTAPALMIFSE